MCQVDPFIPEYDAASRCLVSSGIGGTRSVRARRHTRSRLRRLWPGIAFEVQPEER